MLHYALPPGEGTRHPPDPTATRLDRSTAWSPARDDRPARSTDEKSRPGSLPTRQMSMFAIRAALYKGPQAGGVVIG
jgi:hypothetical protein